MKILVLEPSEPDEEGADKTSQVVAILKGFGHQVVKALPDALLYEQVIEKKPDVVFNLASVWEVEKANRTPAVLEIAHVRYTGSGMLGLSLNRFYNQFFPLLATSGLATVPFRVMKAGQYAPPEDLDFPLTLYKEGSRLNRLINNARALKTVLKAIPSHEDVIVFGLVQGKLESLYILDDLPFLTASNAPCLEAAQKTYAVIEARGLARFDFICKPEPLLAGMDSAPDPLEARLLEDIALAGWDAKKLIGYMMTHAARD